VIRFTSRDRAHGTTWMEGWADPSAGLDDVEELKFLILPGIKLLPLGRPSRGQSLYRLRYHGSQEKNRNLNKYYIRSLKYGPMSY
jgi:hypothetical protein